MIQYSIVFLYEGPPKGAAILEFLIAIGFTLIGLSLGNLIYVFLLRNGLINSDEEDVGALRNYTALLISAGVLALLPIISLSLQDSFDSLLSLAELGFREIIIVASLIAIIANFVTDSIPNSGKIDSNRSKYILAIFVVVGTSFAFYYFIFLSAPSSGGTGPPVSIEWEYNETYRYQVVRVGCGTSIGGESNRVAGSVYVSIERKGSTERTLIWADRRGNGVSEFPIDPGDSLVVPNVSPSDTVYLIYTEGANSGRTEVLAQLGPGERNHPSSDACRRLSTATGSLLEGT
jgi:hypothetical protein